MNSCHGCVWDKVGCPAQGRGRHDDAVKPCEVWENKDSVMGCEYRTCRRTCGFLDKDDHTYDCSLKNCPFAEERK